jgi:hypothetical protein
MKHPVGYTRNNLQVYVDLIHSKAAMYISQQPHMLILVKEALGRISPRGPKFAVEHDMGRPVGYTFVVETSDQDSVLYAQLLRDKLFTRFVKNGKPLASNYLSIMLHKDEQGQGYELHDAWIGRLRPPLPGSDDETDQSKSYWSGHALVLEGQSLQMRTITKECPY